MAQYLPQEYAEMILLYARYDNNAAEAARQYALRHPDGRHPLPGVILGAVNRFAVNGNVMPNRADGGRPRVVQNVELEENILEMAAAKPKISTRRIGRQLNVLHVVARKILREDN